MGKDEEILMAKYQSLVSEWNTIFLTSSILFASCIIGLVMGIIYFNAFAMFISIVLMFVFGTFEYRSRKFYVETKAKLERELGLKKASKEIVEKGLVW
jgi:Ca2+-dependent lipid-binding protein